MKNHYDPRDDAVIPGDAEATGLALFTGGAIDEVIRDTLVQEFGEETVAAIWSLRE